MSPYADELRRQASELLAANPVNHEWRDHRLVFPLVPPDGFDVILLPVDDGIVVTTNIGFHEHLEGSPKDSVKGALGMARDLLSPDMRIREQRAGRWAYRWHAERREDGRWIVESTTGLLFWNYLGWRSERIYQNTHLPGRLEPR